MNNSNAIITSRGEVVHSFSSTICGIRVSKLSSASAAKWTLTVQNIYEDIEVDSVTIEILPTQKTRFETRVEMEVGKGTISCTQHSTYTKQCQILDNSGEWHHECKLYTNIRANSSFECHAYNWGRMEASVEHIVVDIKNSTRPAVGTLEENDHNYVLRCQFTDSVNNCQAEMPNGKDELFLMNGLYTGHYSSYDTL